MGLVAAAPLVVPLLYSSGFDRADELLRLMLLGESVRLAAWTVGYVLVARAARMKLILTEALYNLLLVGGTIALLPSLELAAVGVAFVISQFASMAWTLWFVRSNAGFRMARDEVAVLVQPGRGQQPCS